MTWHEEGLKKRPKSDNERQNSPEHKDTACEMSNPFLSEDPDPDPDDDPARTGVEDELQDLIGRAEERPPDPDEDHLDPGWGGKLPADHPDADVLDDLDL